jgi:predicted amidophosphoribosyltransferase
MLSDRPRTSQPPARGPDKSDRFETVAEYASGQPSRETTLICASCGTTNEAGRKFCKECGSPLVVVCPECASPNTPDSKFCGECGAALGTSAAPAT